MRLSALRAVAVRAMAALVGALALSVGAWTAPVCAAGEIGFEEDFALAKDRAVPLKQLIPATEDYYFYNSLNFENTGQLDEVEKLLKPWNERYGGTARYEEIRNRQALLGYDKDHKKSLDFIIWRLGLTFNHQRELLDKKSDLPTSLDPKAISRETLTQRAMHNHQNLQDFEDSALDWLTRSDLNPAQRRDLLQRLRRPDYENLPQLVLNDLRYKDFPGFGAYTIHKELLLAQLDELLKMDPDFLNQSGFVDIYVTKLQPNPDVDWRLDPKEQQAYLDRLWNFAQRLSPAYNSLKACILYRRLALDRSQGVYDKDRFIEYLKLPRPLFYVNPKYLEVRENRDHPVDLGRSYPSQGLLVPIVSDEPLVRSYLMRFFIEADSWKPFDEYIRDDYLKKVFAETKIVNGLGDMERWYSMLTPEEYQALKERVDIDFAWTNKPVFGADEAVSLDLAVKNVPTLIVKVFEINAMNYYRANLRDIDTAINLDGLVAQERVEKYDEPALRRVARPFPFPELKKRGVYVVEFIGNGKSSRALIRKGQLRFLVRDGVAGQVFTVLDEGNKLVPDARLWMGGKEYQPDKDGKIAVPYSTEPRQEAVILSQGDFASLAFFDHKGENYSLSAGFHVEREALLKRKVAQLAVRPVLRLNGTPVTLSVLEEVCLTIVSTDREGVSTTKEVRDFKLFEDREAGYEFRVPDKAVKFTFALTAKVKSLSQNKKLDLTTGDAFSLNGIDVTEKIQDLHPGHIAGQYFLDLLGKTGEPLGGRAVALRIKHHDFRQPVDVSLQSDAQGRIVLGELKDIDTVTATTPEGATRQFSPAEDRCSYPRAIDAAAGGHITLPYMGRAAQPERAELSLLEVRDQTFVADRFEALKVADGMLQIDGLPAGDYDLVIKESNTHIAIRVTAGEVHEGYVLSPTRHLEVRNAAPLQITSLKADDTAVRIKLANSSPFARVHIVATRYLAEYPLFGDLNVAAPGLTMIRLGKAESFYLSGRDIGDEYRYIIDRRYATKFPGNMLGRPGLLLNPWAINKTETGLQQAAGGTGFASGRGGGGGGEARFFGAEAKHGEAQGGGFADLDYLGSQAVVLLNREPDKDGVVTVKRELLGDHQQVHVLAVDPENTVYRETSLAEVKPQFQNLRLVNGLDPQGHFIEQKQITVVGKEKDFSIADITTSTFEIYDSLGKVYSLYTTLGGGNANLVEFKFLTNWSKLKDEEKREKYSKYACHELNYLLLRKDPAFFEKTIKPYLANKKDKTFMDHWLLGDDLSDYLKPWNFAQLNIVEQGLAGQRVPGEQAVMARHVKELYDLLPPDIERFNFLFNTALKGSSMETAAKSGLFAATERAEAEAERLGAKDKVTDGAFATAAGPAGAAPAAMPAAPPAEAPAANRREAAKPMAAARAMAEKKAEAAAGKDKTGGGEAGDGYDLARKSGDAKGYLSDDKALREGVEQLYRKLDKTEEWVENNYYHLPIAQQNAGLVTVNALWNDFAKQGGAADFFSTNLAEGSRSFTEMMLALAALDLPETAPESKIVYDGAHMQLRAAGPMIVYHKEIKAAEMAPAKEKTILVSQNFLRLGDEFRFENNERIEKYVTDEFLVQVVYACHVVATNPTAARKKVDVLLQVPRGAIPVRNGDYTRSVHVDLEPYHTQTFDYYFYFPTAGDYPHYPVQVSENEKLVAWADPVTLKVVEKLSKIDTTSWDYISQNGTPDEVVGYLNQNNLNRIKLNRIAWRMGDKDYFAKVLALLQVRHEYDQTLWSYGLKHDDVPTIRQYLQNCDDFVNQCGAYIDSPLLVIDPVLRKSYQQMEYSPLVNARAHKLGQKWQIVNDRCYQQYERLMRVLAYRPALDQDDLMSVTYYLLLQDRVGDAQPFFARVDAKKLAEVLQYDYFRAYLNFFADDHKTAREIAKQYEKYPVDRWRKLFANVAAQLDEAEGKAGAVVDEEDRTQQQTRLAAAEPTLDFKVEARKITIDYQNLTECQVNYYLMDVELLFSRQPFIQEFSGQFDYIRPNRSDTVKLAAKDKSYTFDLPKEFESRNVLVEITSAGVKKARAYYANSLNVQVAENYGQVKVTHQQTDKPLAKVYVKVYARMKGGEVRFYKDGYTDLRGRFDYSSLNTNELDFVEKFSLLVMSETDGALVREAAPPKR